MKNLLLGIVTFLLINGECYGQGGVINNGVINAFAGTGIAGYSGDGGQASLAQVDTPKSIAIDQYGNIYIGDGVHIRKIDTSGIITTIAGNGISGYSGDGGPATAAELFWESAMKVDNAGNVYFADAQRIRKINTAGIITTIAGNGVIGYNGDGIAATAAQLNYPDGVAIDASGNVYISDVFNNRVRMVNASGIITTVAGNGTGAYSGDGGPATAAELIDPGGISFDNFGNLLIAVNNRIRKITATGIISTIAGNGINGTSGDGGAATLAQLNNPIDMLTDNSGNLFIFSYGTIREVNATDGKINTIAGANTPGSAYYGDGSFALIARIYGRGYALDNFNSIYIADYNNHYVRKISQIATIKLYIDKNNNCIVDTSDSNIGEPVTTEIDSNGVSIDTVSTTTSFSYFTKGNVGDIYTFNVINFPNGLMFSCPASGRISDTINSLTGNYFAKDIGFECGLISNFDLSVYNVTYLTNQHVERGTIYVNNNSCQPMNATVTLHYSKKYNVVGPSGYLGASPIPTSYTDSTIIWNLTGLSYTNAIPTSLGYAMWTDNACCGYLTPGDTVHSYVTITPTIGDIDTTNNSETIIDTVKAGIDPNEMSVTPSGCMPSGSGITQLQYTMNFMNVGNDTAFNIYVIDSLPNNVDPKSFRIVSASNIMNTTMLHSGVQNILKFDFPNINLLDSAACPLCSGAVIFTVNTLPGLPDGSTILNHAGVYFDYNPVVMTNTVENMIGCPTSVPVVVNNNKVEIYPNPTTNELTIKTNAGAYSSCLIANTMGQLLMQRSLNLGQTQVNVEMLPPGLYYITIRGDNGSVVRKFVKE